MAVPAGALFVTRRGRPKAASSAASHLEAKDRRSFSRRSTRRIGLLIRSAAILIRRGEGHARLYPFSRGGLFIGPLHPLPRR
jgi:hypothetical protein